MFRSYYFDTLVTNTFFSPCFQATSCLNLLGDTIGIEGFLLSNFHDFISNNIRDTVNKWAFQFCFWQRQD